MPVVPYINPNKTPPLPPDTLSLTLLPPLLAFWGFGGLWLAATALPPMLLLICPAQGSPALAILRAYWAGYLFQAVLGLLSPLIFGALIALTAWFMSRKLDPKTRKEVRLTPFLLAPLFLPLFVAMMPGMLSADGPLALCDLAQADIQQIEAGETRRMTVFISGQSHPDPLFTDQPEGWQVARRAIFSPDDGRGGFTLCFPEALESTLDPEGFVVTGRAYDQSWDGVQWYEVSYTTNFQLVVEITPVER